MNNYEKERKRDEIIIYAARFIFLRFAVTSEVVRVPSSTWPKGLAGEPDEHRVFDPVGATKRRVRLLSSWRARPLCHDSHKHLWMETTHQSIRFLELLWRVSQEHRGQSCGGALPQLEGFSISSRMRIKGIVSGSKSGLWNLQN